MVLVIEILQYLHFHTEAVILSVFSYPFCHVFRHIFHVIYQVLHGKNSRLCIVQFFFSLILMRFSQASLVYREIVIFIIYLTSLLLEKHYRGIL